MRLEGKIAIVIGAGIGGKQLLPAERAQDKACEIEDDGPGDQVHVSWAPEASLVLPAADIPTTEDLEEMLDDS